MDKKQWPPTFLVPGTGYVEDKFSMDQVGWDLAMASGWSKCLSFNVYFISIIITLQ